MKGDHQENEDTLDKVNPCITGLHINCMGAAVPKTSFMAIQYMRRWLRTSYLSNRIIGTTVQMN
jgi:hypothetical protein